MEYPEERCDETIINCGVCRKSIDIRDPRRIICAAYLDFRDPGRGGDCPFFVRRRPAAAGPQLCDGRLTAPGGWP